MKITNTAERLKSLMSEFNYRQVDILKKCKPFCDQYNVKLGRNDLSQYVNGKVEPGQEKLTILSLALNVDELWLMGYDVPRSKNIITSFPHQNLNDDVLQAVSVLASYSEYAFCIFAKRYQLKYKDFCITLSPKEVEDFANRCIEQVKFVTENIIKNKLHENIGPISNDYILTAAHDREDIEVTETMKKHDDDIMMDDDEWK